MNGTVEVAATPRDARTVLAGLVELTKPGVTRMVLVTTAFGAIIAPGPVSLLRLAVALAATGAVVGAANTLNMYLERDVDGQMARTRQRPIPSGRVSPEIALAFGVVMALLGLTALTFLVNPTAALLCSIALLSYVFCYTPLKRFTPYALHVGTIPGAIPPLIGWATTTGTLSAAAFTLFAIQVVWQIPHFLAIAIFRQQDYEGAGFLVYPTTQGLFAARRAIVFYSVLLLAVSLTPAWFGLGGAVYLGLVSVLGGTQVVVGLLGLRVTELDRWARRLFFATLPYLVLVYGSLSLSAP
jgi:protoheme IX farnesyltransferase